MSSRTNNGTNGPNTSTSNSNNNNNNDEGNSGPVLLRPTEVPDDIICSICMSVPQDPVVTRACDHIFCRYCLHQSIQHTGSFCPMDRKPCHYDTDVVPLQDGTFIYRIWCNVQVKCQYYTRGCSWTGSIHDFVQIHKESCYYNNTNRKTKRIYHNVNYPSATTIEESDEYTELKDKYVTLQQEYKKIKSDFITVQDKYDQLQRKVNQQIQINRATLRPKEGPFDDTYQYDRNNIIQLSLLIATYLEDKPAEVNANRIYNCIKLCYDDYTRGWKDNPKGYRLDTRMLLTTAVASNWFTPKQFSNLNQWLRDQDWF